MDADEGNEPTGWQRITRRTVKPKDDDGSFHQSKADQLEEAQSNARYLIFLSQPLVDFGCHRRSI
jgi:hypothetical protein